MSVLIKISNKQVAVFLVFALFLMKSSYGQTGSCDSLAVPPCKINGVGVSQSSTGSVTTFPSAYTSCGLTTPANSAYVGLNGPFTYTLHFEKAVTSVSVVLTATGNPGDENFIFTTDSEIPQVIENNGCFSRVEGNQVFSGAKSVPEGGGGLFTIKTKKPFKSMTVSGDGGLAGTIMAFCATAITKTNCAISSLSPILNQVKISSLCNPATVSLDEFKVLNLKPGLILSWHTDNVAQENNQLLDKNVNSGTYFAAFYDPKEQCFSKTSLASVYIYHPPQVNVGADLLLCEGDSIRLIASGASKYSWDKGVLQGVYFKPEISDVYTVIGSNDKACTDTSSISVTVNPKPKVSAGPELYVMQGEKITLAAEGAEIYSWNHDLYQGASFEPDTAKIYIVTGKDKNNCFNSDTLRFHVQKKQEIKLEEIPLENFNAALFKPINLVFLLDVSTSMIKHEKFELLKYSVSEMLRILRPQDRVALVSFASNASVLLPMSGGNEKQLIQATIDKLTVSGKSAGTKGIKRGFRLAAKNYIPDGTNMVIILTDGAINQENDDYLKIISKYQKQNIYFSVVGIKNFPKDEERMREAAQLGNGAYVPIFSYDDAKKNLILEIKERAFRGM